ncbi:MAG: helix-turn-helix transcriptional regulator [Bdellovibrionales bacterium]|nr:helix-turn-helix transcriptional regulator [Bdellovibrionales bacterium]
MATKRKGTNELPFGKILKRIMQERDLTVRAVAELAGVSGSVVQSWINQANPHDLKAVAKLAKGLKMEFKELLLGEVEHTSEVRGIAELFQEQDLFDGHCKIIIKRLVPRKEK